MKRLFLLPALLVMLLASPLEARKGLVAVLEPSLLNLPLLHPEKMAEVVRGRLRDAGYQVLSGDRVNAILKGKKIKKERCNEVECAVEYGGVLGVAKIFTGHIIKLGRRTVINFKYVDVNQARAEKTARIQYVGPPERLPGIMRLAVKQLLAAKPGKSAPRPTLLSFDGPKEPFYKKPWFIITVSTLVAGGLATGLILGLTKKSSPSTTPGGVSMTW